MKTDDYLLAIFMLAVAGVCIAFGLVVRQLIMDFVPSYDPVAHDVERVLTLLWRLLDLVAERCRP